MNIQEHNMCAECGSIGQVTVEFEWCYPGALCLKCLERAAALARAREAREEREVRAMVEER